MENLSWISNFLQNLKIPKLKSIQLCLPSNYYQKSDESLIFIFENLKRIVLENDERFLESLACGPIAVDLRKISEILVHSKSLKNLKIGFKFKNNIEKNILFLIGNLMIVKIFL